jgi:23S rRNA (adenine2503-C2)-methyltransferase
MPIVVKNLTADELHERLAHLGLMPRQARQIQGMVMKRGRLPGAAESGIAATLLREVERCTVIPQLTVVEKRVSTQDGFAKYLFRAPDGEQFEAVRIPLLHRPDDPKYVVCVSCQVGCALGCRFCATGRMGFRRDLAAWEIVDQVIQIQADLECGDSEEMGTGSERRCGGKGDSPIFAETKIGTVPAPVRGVVFMGMGESLLNYDGVMQAARICTESCGLAIAGKAITISTAGIVPGIRRFITERQPYRLVVSLNMADPAERREWMPVEKAYPTAELMEALREYHAATGRRVILAWTMIAGVNTRAEDARQLAELTRGLPVKIDLIDVNDPTGRWQAPSDEERNAFRDALSAELGAPVGRRYSGGRDIHAACGMLAGGAAGQDAHKWA